MPAMPLYWRRNKGRLFCARARLVLAARRQLDYMRAKGSMWLMLAATIMALAWPAWETCRWMLAWRVYAAPELAAPAITHKHIMALRKLRFSWNTLIESGGPVVDPWSPYGSENMAVDLGQIIGTSDQVAIARFHREISALLIGALKHCDIAAGQYRLAHLDNAWMEQRLRRDLAGLPPERIAAVVARVPRLNSDNQFQFTDQHRRLLRELRLEWPDHQLMWIVARSGYPAPTVHFKRPFGDMTAFDIDMANILGLPRPPQHALDPVLERLYWEMWPALQTFVEHASFDASCEVISK
jgi:hypothetical protein